MAPGKKLGLDLEPRPWDFRSILGRPRLMERRFNLPYYLPASHGFAWQDGKSVQRVLASFRATARFCSSPFQDEGFRSHRDPAAERTNLKPEGLSYRNMARFCRGGFPWILLPFHNAQSRNEQRKWWPQLPQKSIFQECANAFWI